LPSFAAIRHARCLWFGATSSPPRPLQAVIEEFDGECIACGEIASARRQIESGEIGALLVDLAHPDARELLHDKSSHEVARIAIGDAAGLASLPGDVELLDPARSAAELARGLTRALHAASRARALARTEQQLERAHRFARIGSFDIDWNTQTVRCTSQALRIFGLKGAPAEMPLQEFAARVGAGHPEPWHCWWSTLAAGAPHGAFEQRLSRVDGGERVLRLHGERVTAASGTIVLTAVVHDITDRRRVEEELEFQANHDDLTGLANRRQLKDTLIRALRDADAAGDRVAVFLLDLDRFKDVNESLGHTAGDRLLIEMASRLRAGLRSGESLRRRGHAPDLIARVGGDEFAVVVGQLGHEDSAAAIGDRLQEAFAAPIELADREIGLTTCIGFTVSRGKADDATEAESAANELIKQAETAMHAAKARGRSTLCRYEPSMRRDAEERLELEAAMRRGLERGEFEVWYQPRIDLRGGRIVGFEALVRWRRPEIGLVPPLQFIPLAEECGFIVPLGAFVVREACRQAQEWRNAGFTGLSMAVNVSAAQFRDRGLEETILEALSATGLPASALELELTESTIMDDVESALVLLKQLKARGVHLAIDDFGTGYSSLAYLKRLPLDCLKIDRSFVSDVTTSADAAAIAALIVTMAHRLRLSVVAEGAETDEQVEFLRREGCDQVQGFFFGKPTPAAEATALLERQLVAPSG
jgi:diguanylate cyclase (GGDEF)-like protein